MMSIFLSLYLFFIGTAIGSFLNVLADRLPNGESILGRSHCDHCGRTLGAQDLIPLFSFLYIGGKCRTCKNKLSPQYFVMELITGAMFVLVWWFAPVSGDRYAVIERVTYLVGVSSLLVLFVADLRYQILPDLAQITLVGSILVLIMVSADAADISGLQAVLRALYAAIVVMAPIFLLHVVTRGNGMGFGDVKLAFSIGLLHGIAGGLLSLYIAFVLGGLYGAALLATSRKGLKSKIAFGPFLLLGMTVMFIWGEAIQTYIHAYYLPIF